MASSQEKYQLILEAREAAADKIKKLNKQINNLGGPAMVKSQREIKRLERELKTLNTTGEKGPKIFTKFTSGIAIGTIAANAAMRAFSAFTGFIKGTFQAALESEKVWNDVAASLDRHRGAVDVNIESVRKFADQMQTLSGISDELIGTAFQRLHDQNISVADSMELTRAAMDLSVAKGMDLATTADLIGKSINSSTNALSRYGIEIDKSLPKQEQLAQVQTRINEMFGGAAAARMLTTAGKLELLKQRMGDLQEAIGGVVIQSPAFEYFLNLVSDAAQYWSGFAVGGNLEAVEAQIATITAELAEQARLAAEYDELPWYRKAITTAGYAEERAEALRQKLVELQYQQQILSDQAERNIAREKAQATAAATARLTELKASLKLPDAETDPDTLAEIERFNEQLRIVMGTKMRELGPMIQPDDILPVDDMGAVAAQINADIRDTVNADIIARQQGQFTAAFAQIGRTGIDSLSRAIASGRGKVSDVFKQMHQDFMAFFIKQALASIANMFIPGLGSLLGGIFDTPRYDRLAMEQGEHFAHYFAQGVFRNMRSGSEFMRGIVPSAANLAMPAAAAAPAIAGGTGSTINVTFSGNVLSPEFIEHQVAPTLRKLVTNGKSDLALSAENVTGGRNVRVY